MYLVAHHIGSIGVDSCVLPIQKSLVSSPQGGDDGLFISHPVPFAFCANNG